MALLTSELTRIKAELGYNLLDVGAEPYISVVAIFEQVIQPYLLAGATTTSSTTVTAATTPTAVTLTLDSATGFSTGDTIIVDVPEFQERATIQSLSGADAVVPLTKSHSGTYPVTVEGGESIVREILKKIADVKDSMSESYGAGSLKKVDEIEFYNTGGNTYFGTLGDNLRFWRNELASYLGIVNMWDVRRGNGRRLSVY